MWRALWRFFFQLLYNECAWAYDLVAWLVSFGQWQAWGRTALAHLHGERVLELGHGTGHLLVAMAKRGWAPAGLDVSRRMGQQARRRLDVAGLIVPLLRGRAQALPFRTACLDSVVATFPSAFIIDSRTLHEVSRVLGPAGRLILVLWARMEGGGLIARLLGAAYRVSGQNEPSPEAFQPWLEGIGLSSREVWMDVGRTKVLLVVAEKS